MKQINRELILLGLIILVALSARVWGIDFGLPYIYHPDEPRYITSAQLLFKTHDLNPNTLPDISSSSFVYVINALAYIPYYLLGKLLGVFNTPLDIPAPKMLAMGTGNIAMSTAFLLGRIVTMLFSTANVVLTFLIGRRLFKTPAVGLLAAFMLATSPTNVNHGRFVTPDTFVVFFTLVIFLGAVHIYQSDETASYIWSGIALGCLVSTKISGGLALIPFLTAHFYRKKLKGLLFPNFYLMLIVSGFAFLAATPYLIGDFRDVINDILYEGRHYSTGHSGMEGNSLVWYLNYMWQTAGVIYLIAALEILRSVYSRSTEIIGLSIFPIVYFLFVSSFVVRNDRTLLPLTPFLFLLAASFLVSLWNRARTLQSKMSQKASILAIASLLAIGLIMPISETITNTIRLTTVDSRETARIWINDNLPAGARIAIESYSPFVEPTRFSVQSFGAMLDHDPEWFIGQGFDYLVFSQGMYKRFYFEPERYGLEISQYDNLFKQFHLLRLFTDGGYEVRIYKVK